MTPTLLSGVWGPLRADGSRAQGGSCDIVAYGLAVAVLLGLGIDYALRRMRMPGLIGMLLVGVLLGPQLLGVFDPELLDVSFDLRMIALIVILLRAGLELSRETLHRVGLRVALLACVPAILEGGAVTLLGPHLLGLTLLESALLGAILAAVSPAVVVPLMLDFIDRRMGERKGIPTLILAASAVDDVFVIVVFSALLGLAAGEHLSLSVKLLEIPVAIGLGIAVGLLIGDRLYRFFIRFNPRATKRALITVALAILLVTGEEALRGRVPFSGLLAVMAIGFMVLERSPEVAHELSAKLSKVWVLAEILLFVLVGAQVDVAVAWHAGLAGAALIGIALVARSVGTYLCLMRSDLTVAERLFCVVAYLPKATVQAAIGATPLAVGIPGGEAILAVAVLSILLTAPAGAVAIRILGERTLVRNQVCDC